MFTDTQVDEDEELSFRNQGIGADKCPHIIPVGYQAGWFGNIKKVCKDAIYRQEMGLANGEWCRDNFDLVKVNKLRSQVFESLI